MPVQHQAITWSNADTLLIGTGWEQASAKLEWLNKNFNSSKHISQYCLQSGGHVVQVSRFQTHFPWSIIIIQTGLQELTRYSSISRINTLGPTDAIWRHKAWLTWVQVMACCLTAPSHYLNPHWLIISEFLCHLPEGSSTGNVQYLYLIWVWISLTENYSCISKGPVS